MTSYRLPLILLGLIALFTMVRSDYAAAVPSFSRQTGQECAVCHTGGFGPQLTPYGIRFKVGGYVETSGTDTKVPLSAMAEATFTNTKAALPDNAGKFFGENNNIAVQELSLFLAGKLVGEVGSFTQVTYSGIERKTSLDNVDIRAAHEVSIGNQTATIGLTLNNNPTVQDPFNGLPAWRVPYISSELAPSPSRTSVLNGWLTGRVAGLNAYSMFENGIYAELGGYGGLPQTFLETVNVVSPNDPGITINGVAPYGRFGFFKDMKNQSFYAGVVAMNSQVRPFSPMGAGSDRYTDVGVDATYQFLGDRKHVVTVTGSYLWEFAKLNYSYNLGLADNSAQNLNEWNIAATYYYDKTYGLTLRYFNTVGSRDYTFTGARTGKPDSSGVMAQIDWTPFGKEGSWMAPWANLRLGVQYTAYTKFNGASSNYDGNGRNAADNNMAMAFAWIAF